MTSKAKKAQRLRRARGSYIYIHNPQDGWAAKFQADHRYKAPGKNVRWIEAPVVVKSRGKPRVPNDAYVAFLSELRTTLRSAEGVAPEDWKVVMAVTHGGKDGTISFDLRGDDPTYKAPNWWTASAHFRAFYDLGVRRVHFHTCCVGHSLHKLPVTGTRSAQGKPMKVTGWDSTIWETDGECSSDAYLFQGMPGCCSMRQNVERRAWKSICEVDVDASGRVLHMDRA